MKKLTKKEIDTFMDKSYLIILTVPFRYHNSRKINSIKKKFSDLSLSICFSKAATSTAFWHCFFQPSGYIFDSFKIVMAEKKGRIEELLNEVNRIIS